jgi:Predicted signal transduction protein with a C-terminal ATPase domain
MNYSKLIKLSIFIDLLLWIVCFCTGSTVRTTAFILGTLWTFACGTAFFRAFHEIELMLEALPDERKMNDQADRCKSKEAKRVADQIRAYGTHLDQSYSASMMDKQSRISALQSQINPHFLYNTLECIRSEAIIQHCDSIARMSKALASFFRYSISRRENIVTIQDELSNIQNYFLIQDYRFENKFALHIEVTPGDENVYDAMIPKMTLQPIVENAIFHGLETKSEKGNVTIRIAAAQDLLHIVISDDGVGISHDKLALMRKNMDLAQSQQGNEASGNGIALYNVNQRLKITFGETYGLQLYSTEGVGTDVEILIPLEYDRDKFQL